MSESVRVIGVISDYPKDACVFCGERSASPESPRLEVAITGPGGRTMEAVAHWACFRERVEPRQQIVIDFALAPLDDAPPLGQPNEES
jgi:hypothetical protein